VNSTVCAPKYIAAPGQQIAEAATMSNSEWNDPEANVLPEKVKELEKNNEIPKNTKRKRVVVVGLGMVGISFMYGASREQIPSFRRAKASVLSAKSL